MNINEWYDVLSKEYLAEYIKNKQEENLYIEFKEISDAGFTLKEDKKNFAKALSGFANSSGGLLIWGIKARKNDEGIDCACAESPVKSLSLFLSKLNEFTGSFVTPIVEGIQHKPIEISGDTGFAVTLIPESDSGPHMAKAGEDRYYKRSGGSFYKMEHFDIEDMFGRRKKPKLSLYHEIIKYGKSTGARGHKYQGKVIIGIENNGRGIAKYPQLSLRIDSPYNISPHELDGNGNSGLPKIIIKSIRNSQPKSYVADSNIVIHPQTSLDVTAIDVEITDTIQTIDDVVINYEITAENMQQIKGESTIKGNEIINSVRGV